MITPVQGWIKEQKAICRGSLDRIGSEVSDKSRGVEKRGDSVEGTWDTVEMVAQDPSR